MVIKMFVWGLGFLYTLLPLNNDLKKTNKWGLKKNELQNWPYKASAIGHF